ncbi:MAG: hypothetical protein M0036_20165 [Desulfobacteraceae bacterium]|nr:hypothetical protein [Desulfobacteraceae bacterium]
MEHTVPTQTHDYTFEVVRACGPPDAERFSTPSSAREILEEVNNAPAGHDFLKQLLWTMNYNSIVGSAELLEKLSTALYERKLAVIRAPRNGKEEKGAFLCFKPADEAPAPAHSFWTDGSRPMKSWQDYAKQKLRQAPSNDTRHKLALEIGGTGAFKPLGQLKAVASGGAVGRIDLCNGPADDHRRVLSFQVPKPDQYQLFLKIDGFDGCQEIPLLVRQKSATCPMPSQKEQWETVLIPIVPRCYTSVSLLRSKDNADYPRPGWIYIYIDGFLWRELQVKEKGFFSDVNLEKMKGQDERDATGKPDTVIVLPFQVNGVKPRIEICFSEIQWSWAQVQALGGLDPADSRNQKGAKTEPCSDKAKAAELRQKRLQPVQLDDYPNFNQPTGPIGSADQKGEEGERRSDLASFRGTNLPVFYLHDALGIAESLVGQYHEALIQLRDIVAGLSGLKNVKNLDSAMASASNQEKAAYFRSAVLAYRLFFDTQPTSAKGGPPRVIANCKRHMDQNLLENTLQIQKRRELRRDMRFAKLLLAQWLDDKVQDQLVTAKHANFVSVNAMLSDYANLNGEGYGLLWHKAAGLFAYLNHEPSHEDVGMELSQQVREEVFQKGDPGCAYLNRLLTPDHPLHALLMPTQEQVDEFSEKYSSPTPEPADGQGKFRPGAFAALIQSKTQSNDKSALGLLKINKQLADDLLFIFTRQFAKAQQEQSLKSVSCLVRLAKATAAPHLDGLRIFPAGSTIDLDGQDYVIFGAGEARLQALNRALFLKERPGSTSPGAIPLRDADAANPIATIAEQGKGRVRFTSETAAICRSQWRTLFAQETAAGQGGYKARTDLLVTSAANEYGVKYYNADKPFGGRGYVKGVKAAMPPIIAILEAINFGRACVAFVGQFSTRSFDFKKTGYLATSLFAMPYYLFDGAVALAGEEAVKQGLGHSGKILFETTVTFMKSKVTIFKAWSAGVTGITGLWCLYDMAGKIHQEDYDSAACYGVAAAGYAGMALAKIGQAAGQRALMAAVSGVATEAGPLAVLGPYTTVFLIIGLIATAAAIYFTDTDLEVWAKNGPFAKEGPERWQDDFKDKSAVNAMKKLIGLLMQPQLRISYNDTKTDLDAHGRNLPRVVVECTAPGFDKDASELVVETTALNLLPALTSATRNHHDPEAPQFQSPLSKEEIIDNESGRPMGVRLEYQGLGRQGHHQWRARAVHLITLDGTQAGAPSGDRQKSNPDKIIPGESGWVYAEA